MTDDDVKQITQMAKTLESLNGLARAEEARGTQAEESDLDAIRARLQDRLDRLRSGGGETLRGNADG
ncbi:MAG: hypothetical protein KDI98_07645 [Hyphomicrobiaceae bacterium]|nr:hypothetical protein [Hyphomicrobiaceae bacterium]